MCPKVFLDFFGHPIIQRKYQTKKNKNKKIKKIKICKFKFIDAEFKKFYSIIDLQQ